MSKELKKKIYAIALIFILIMPMALSGCTADTGEDPAAETEEESTSAPPSNPLTGELVEDGFDESALDRRVMGFVVENAPDARPQWGMDDEKYSPDILVQGEVEGGITRTLWLYADYKKMPEYIGPMRSARPPFILFSRLFDAVFIHWGMSYSKGDYIGANKIFQWYKVDHINQMTLDDKEGLYDRDHTRYVSSEHTGILYPSKLEATLKNEGIRTTPKEYSKLYFFDEPQPVSSEPAANISVTYSKQSDWETTDWTYNEKDGMYHTSSFENDFKRDNLLILYDDTEYITKDNYHGSGSGVTYCDYLFKGGRAQLFSKGTVKELQWDRRAGKLILMDPDKNADEIIALNSDEDESNDDNETILAELPLSKDETKELIGKFYQSLLQGKTEEEMQAELGDELSPKMYVPQQINKGKTWIGWISNNNGGSVKVSN